MAQTNPALPSLPHLRARQILRFHEFSGSPNTCKITAHDLLVARQLAGPGFVPQHRSRRPQQLNGASKALPGVDNHTNNTEDEEVDEDDWPENWQVGPSKSISMTLIHWRKQTAGVVGGSVAAPTPPEAADAKDTGHDQAADAVAGVGDHSGPAQVAQEAAHGPKLSSIPSHTLVSINARCTISIIVPGVLIALLIIAMKTQI